MKNWRQIVISQYNNSPTLVSLLELVNDWISPDANMEAFYTLVMDVETAVGYGLDVWGRIVGVVRELTITDNYYFGFAEQNNASFVGTFGQAPFYSGENVTSNFSLTDDAFRLLIFAKAAANLTDGSIPSVNAILMNLFPNRGNCYVTDGRNAPWPARFGFAEAGDVSIVKGFNQAPFGDFVPARPGNMTEVYTFEFPLEPFEQAIVKNSGVLPRSLGVAASASYPT